MKPLQKHFHKIPLVFQYFYKVKSEFFVETWLSRLLGTKELKKQIVNEQREKYVKKREEKGIVSLSLKLW